MLKINPAIHARLKQGQVIPACPLALNSRRQLDERRQRALFRYYVAAGSGGIALAVHTTQFAIREAGLHLPILELGAEELDRHDPERSRLIRIAGICGPTAQAVSECNAASSLGWQAGLLNLTSSGLNSETAFLSHAREVQAHLPIVGFYLQPAVGGRVLSYKFWREFCDLENVVAIKIAPFNRYQTLDVVRALVDSNRKDIALYTGNDDNIVVDLLSEFSSFRTGSVQIAGGLLGHWSVWTRKAVELLETCKKAKRDKNISSNLITQSWQVTDSNAAFFDAANNYQGCIAGLHEVLRRQGLLEGIWCLDPNENLSPGQAEEVSRVYAAYPHLNDDAFVAENLDSWMR